jgi:DNA-binding response OmpR family regulator
VRLLIAEDEVLMQDLLMMHLSEDYDVTIAKDGAEALEKINLEQFDAILLDIMLPYVDGFTLCAEIRRMGQTPILMLTARTEIEDRVRGLELGADDYLVKPFDFAELKARIHALIRRANIKEEKQTSVIQYGSFKMDMQSFSVYVANQKVDLTVKEFELLKQLALTPNQVFTRDDLLHLLWEEGDERDGRAIDSHVKNIRYKMKKIGATSKLIKTVWGLGYQFDMPEDAHV